MSPQPESSSMTNTRELFKTVMKGGWDEVIRIYKHDPEAQKDRITRSGYTALHLAVSDGNEDIVAKLVQALEGDQRAKEALEGGQRAKEALEGGQKAKEALEGGQRAKEALEGGQKAKEALAMKNDAGNTPLHIAASMGNVRMCKLIADVDSRLIGIKNNDGETPLFLAALNGKKDAFLCLHSFCPADVRISCCRRNDRNTILHCAIAGEYFDLAFQIIQLYNDLVDSVNLEGSTPLHVLATKPSAFESGSNLGRFQNMVYKILFVDKLKVDTTYEEKKPFKNEQKSSCPPNYQTLVNFFHCVRQILKGVASSIKSADENSTSTKEKREGSAPGQKAISRKYAEEKTIENPTNKETKGSGFGQKEEEIHPTENSTTSTNMEGEHLEGSAGEQKGDPQAIQTREKDFLPPNYVTCFGFVKVVYKAMLILTGPGYDGVTNILDEKRKHTWSLQVLDELLQSPKMYEHENPGQGPPRILDNESKEELILDVEAEGSEMKVMVPRTTKKDSPILIAAKHGIIEIVKKILEKFPVAIHDTLEDKKNIVLIAVENRQLEVYKLLLRKYDQNEGMFRKVDMNGDGALHFAANHKIEHPRWPIPGDALQMQWEIKWLKFVEESKPKHFFVRYNSKCKTPDEIFTETHKDLVEGGGKWMKSTAESCSLVAALIATVAFATSTALPGGVDDQSGKPHLETKPGFQVFAIASLIALCFSVTSLVMFLAILTSRYQEKDFGRDLPWKLLLGLTSLFVSIASMLVSFCAGHFFVLEDTIRYAAFPVYALTGIPVTFFAAAQFPLYFDLVKATFRSPFGDHIKSSDH